MNNSSLYIGYLNPITGAITKTVNLSLDGPRIPVCGDTEDETTMNSDILAIAKLLPGGEKVVFAISWG